jgi:hypothetical protein
VVVQERDLGVSVREKVAEARARADAALAEAASAADVADQAAASVDGAIALAQQALEEAQAYVRFFGPYARRRGGSVDIRDGAITANHLTADSVTAIHIDVDRLSAISADLGSIKVDTAHIGLLAVDTLQIANNVVSDGMSAWTSATAVFTGSGLGDWQTVQTLVVTKTRSDPVLVAGVFEMRSAGYSAGLSGVISYYKLRVFDETGGADLAQTTRAAGSDCPALSVSAWDTGSWTGSRTLRLKAMFAPGEVRAIEPSDIRRRFIGVVHTAGMKK